MVCDHVAEGEASSFFQKFYSGQNLLNDTIEARARTRDSLFITWFWRDS